MDIEASNVLLCLRYGIGDLIMELPVIDRLRRMRIVQNLHLRRVTALLAHCELYVGNDSGLMHLAAAVQTPVVILFGPTNPYLYLPGWVRAKAITGGVACPYRLQRAFGHPRCILAGSCLLGTPCIQAIDPAQVYAAVREECAKVS